MPIVGLQNISPSSLAPNPHPLRIDRLVPTLRRSPALTPATGPVGDDLTGSCAHRHNHLRFRPRINSMVSARPHAFSVGATIPPPHSGPAIHDILLDIR